MKLVLKIAAGVLLGGILLDLVHWIEADAALNAAAETLPKITQRAAAPDAPPIILEEPTPQQPAQAQTRVCEAKNAKGETFRC